MLLEVNKESQTMIDLHTLLEAMEKREYNIAKFKWIIGSISVFFIYLSGKQIRSWISSATSKVTQQSMDDPNFQAKVKETATDVLKNMLNDTQLRAELEEYANTVICSVLSGEQVSMQLKSLTTDLLLDPEIHTHLGNAIYSSITPAFLAPSKTIISSQTNLLWEPYDGHYF